MVGAVLSVVFQNQESSIVPIGAVRYGVNDTPDCQVIVSNRRGRPGFVLGSTRGVVVRKTKKDELRHGVLVRIARGNEIVEFIQEFIGTELVGIGDLEIRKQGIEVAT